MNQQPAKPGLFIGIDWADQKHDCYVIDRNGGGFHQELPHSAENIDAWVGAGPVTSREAAQLCAQIAEALEHEVAHFAGHSKSLISSPTM